MKKIEAFDKQVLEFLRIKSFDKRCDAQIKDIAKDLKCSYSRVYSSLGRLLESKSIEADQSNAHGSPYIFILQGE